MTVSFDYVIVGGGTAGCALAARIKQGNPKCSVVLIERGQDARRDPAVLSPMGIPKLVEAGVVSILSSEPQAGLDGRRITLQAGQMLSGSSGVNAGVWMRGHSTDYNEWAKMTGDERWSYAGLLPYFQRSESCHKTDASKELHGFNGPIKTATSSGYPLRQPVHDALSEIGLENNPDGNSGNPFGICEYVENWRPTRQPAGLAYDLEGVHIITGAAARQIILSDDAATKIPRATGVKLHDGREVLANREVVLSCGSYGTPQILMLSGIGPAQQLSTLGIPVRVQIEDVGSNLFDHLACYSCWRLKPDVVSRGVAMGSPSFMSQPGYLEGLPCDWMGVRSLDSADDEDFLRGRATHWLNIFYMPIALGEGSTVEVDGAHISIGTLNFQPTSRGSVTLVSTDPLAAPIISPGYLSTRSDRAVMRSGFREVLRLAESHALQSVIDGEEVPAGLVALHSQSPDEEIDDRIKRCCVSIHHPAGTCAAGKVVDSELRVNGVLGLRVCDASIFPAPISATTQAAVYAVAECLADILLGKA